ncbi:MAG: ATP/cobalamin adenosyltransferase [Phycisphaerales bacterium]|jgi:cob(I)alamin adenosyltransferase|nr:ATP/cobalamin adenosyltransferase [Phycisphaerales bacterium]
MGWMKIYTKTGDDGTTGLIGGSRVSKGDARIECYGTVDELNAGLGLAMVAAEQGAAELTPMLRRVQNELFVVGSHLATPDQSPHRKSLPPLDEKMVTRLEEEIDAAETRLAPLRQFILPGGTEAAARLHLARTVCRRAERLLVRLSHPDEATSFVVKYLNRLSDWLFVQARRANAIAGVADVPWEKK